jgi:serine/threonine-protein kinase
MDRGDLVAGRYEIDAVLGEGGSAVVWSATDRQSGERVALKMLKERSIERRVRFTREARAAMALTHASVVRIRDVGEHEQPFLVMDLLEGETLDRRFAREGKIPVAELAPLFARVISAVGAAHALGIVHRDLKPANIFLLPDGQVRVLDFGLAKLTVDEPTNVTETGERLGTPRYMSPEQVQGRRDVDHRSDVWSLGIMLYEGLAGAHPIPRAPVAQTFDRVTRAAFKPLGEVAPELPRDLAEITSRMLSRERELRPELAEVLAVIARHASGVEPTELPTARISRTSDESWRHEPTADDTRYPAPDRKTRSPLLFGAIAIIVALAAAVAWVIRQ